MRLDVVINYVLIKKKVCMKFGVDKCKLLISARPTKLKEVETILEEEPNLLTIFGKTC